MKKKETFYQKENRVIKELRKYDDLKTPLTKLTNDQRTVLHVWYSDHYNKSFSLSTINDPFEKDISMQEVKMVMEKSLKKAEVFSLKHNLFEPTFGLDTDNYNRPKLAVCGYVKMSDQDLIACYMGDVIALKKEKEEEKADKAKEKQAKKNINSKEEAIKEIARLAKRFSI